MLTISLLFDIILAFLIQLPHPEINNELQVKGTEYNLSKPDKVYYLPATLNEISGITEIDDISVGCIQDENGVLFIYDLEKETVRKQLFFYPDGDYEGITRIGRSVYTLRSDGTLIMIDDYQAWKLKVSQFTPGFPAGNYEGLCYDKGSGRLLVAPKEIPGKYSDDDPARFIFTVNLNTKKAADKPAFVLNLPEMKKFALQNKLKIPMKEDKKDKKEPRFNLNPSDLAVHPLSGQLYVLSGNERLLFIFDNKGRINNIIKLDPDIFNQPEGITFMSDGDMLISNEGQNKRPTIVRFNYTRN